MEKKIENVFIYLDYRILLNDDFILRSDANPRYSLRAYSRDLDLSPTFLSEILRGKKDLGQPNSRLVFSKLGLSDQEIDYAENLVVSKSAKSEERRSTAMENIKAHYVGAGFVYDNSRDLLVQSTYHFMVFGLIRKINSLRALYKMTDHLGIERNITDEIIHDFTKGNYIVCNDDSIKVLNDRFTLRNHEKLVEVLKEFSDILHVQIQKEGGAAIPQRVVNGLIMGVDEESFDLIHEAHKHFLKTVHRLGDQNKNTEKIIFISDVFYSYSAN